MFGRPEKLETEQLIGILNWDGEHINHLILVYNCDKKSIKAFQKKCKIELIKRNADY